MSAAEKAMTELLELMARLRDPERGCPWDVRQTFATIAPYTIEEAYEVADAIERGDPAQIRDELGDLLFQVVFHARMAQERGWFDFAAVAAGIPALVQRRDAPLNLRRKSGEIRRGVLILGQTQILSIATFEFWKFVFGPAGLKKNDGNF